MKSIILAALFGILFILPAKDLNQTVEISKNYEQYIIVLGIAQDGGYPHIGCEKVCCIDYYEGKEAKKRVSSLGLVNKISQKTYIFDATPDFTEQNRTINSQMGDGKTIVDGIFLTHAHIGHYTGLMYLGREALGANKVSVYSMPKMKHFLENNGPWNQLVNLNNIELRSLKHDSTIKLDTELKIVPFLVPHRDEYSETVGYKIIGKSKTALFIPDIDKWERWNRNIIEEVQRVDYAFLDASFFRDGEIERDMSKIPHPFTTETTSLFESESKEVKSKIHFIHFNHSNPTIKLNHRLKDSIKQLGFNFAEEGKIFGL